MGALVNRYLRVFFGFQFKRDRDVSQYMQTYRALLFPERLMFIRRLHMPLDPSSHNCFFGCLFSFIEAA